jgi:hypothetical protein
MEYSTHVTAQLCPMVLKDMLRLVLDGDNGRIELDGAGRCGDWELV